MQTIDVISFFTKLNIDYLSKRELFLSIGDATAIRYKNGVPFRRNYERGLLLYGIAEYFKCKSFLEIGTGRGYVTACVSTSEHVEKIDTIDIESTEMAIECLNQVSGVCVNKINFITQDSKNIDFSKLLPSYDMIFIDGEHTHDGVKNDFSIASRLSNIIIFDDYRNKHKGVKSFIKSIVKSNEICWATVVSSDGWIYENKFIKSHGDVDKLIDGKEHKSGQVVSFLKKNLFNETFN